MKCALADLILVAVRAPLLTVYSTDEPHWYTAIVSDDGRDWSQLELWGGGVAGLKAVTDVSDTYDGSTL